MAFGAVNQPALAEDAVTSDKIADGAILASDLDPALASNTFWRLNGNSVGTGAFLGTTGDEPLEFKVNGQRALRLEPATNGAPNVIGGSRVNSVRSGAVGATISGGGALNYSGFTYPNSVAADFATVGGGDGNTIGAWSPMSVIGGGDGNTIQTNAPWSTIAGGFSNTIQTNAVSSTIGGGSWNEIQTYAWDSTIGGGWDNTIQTNANNSTIAGGNVNRILANAQAAAIGGGDGNTVQPNAHCATIPGGGENVAGGCYSLAAGRRAKAVHPGVFVWADSTDADFASTRSNQFLIRASGGVGIGTNNTSAALLTVAGVVKADSFVGAGLSLSGPLQADGLNVGANHTLSGQWSSIVGEGNNTVLADFASIAGGDWNDICTGSPESAIGGGYDNNVADNSQSATIAGGLGNNIGKDSDSSAIGGGWDNNIADNSICATIAAGDNNQISTSSCQSAIGGGWANFIAANSYEATNAGGDGNYIGEKSSQSAIGGGYWNYALGKCCTVPGGSNNVASGNFTFAAGQRAKALHEGAFVWADSTNADFASTRADEFAIRAAGGVRIQSNRGIELNAFDGPMVTRGHNPFSASAPTEKQGHGRWGLFMEPHNLVLGFPGDDVPNSHFQVAKYGTDGTYTDLVTVDQTGDLSAIGDVYAKGVKLTSDRNAKANFAPVNVQAVLAKVAALPLSQWNYKTDPAEQKHVGPMAQDFHAAFGLGGPDDRHISVVDEGGVALAAIQGLNQKLGQKLAQKETEIVELKQRLEKLEQLLNARNGRGQ